MSSTPSDGSLQCGEEQAKGMEDGKVSEETTRKLVFSYLVHCGYKSSALEFWKRCSSDFPTSQDIQKPLPIMKLIDERKELYDLIIQRGKIDMAVKLLNKHFDGLLERNNGIRFDLMVLKFIDIITEKKNRDALLFCQQEISKIVRVSMPQEIGRDCQYLDQIKDMLALLCYENPEKSPVNYLLADGFRIQIAENVNSSILDYLNLPKEAPLMTITKQITIVNQRLNQELKGGNDQNWSLEKFLKKNDRETRQ